MAAGTTIVLLTPAALLSGIARLIVPDEATTPTPPVVIPPETVPVIVVAPGAHIVEGVADTFECTGLFTFKANSAVVELPPPFAQVTVQTKNLLTPAVAVYVLLVAPAILV